MCIKDNYWVDIIKSLQQFYPVLLSFHYSILMWFWCFLPSVWCVFFESTIFMVHDQEWGGFQSSRVSFTVSGMISLIFSWNMLDFKKMWPFQYKCWRSNCSWLKISGVKRSPPPIIRVIPWCVVWILWEVYIYKTK